MSWIEEEENEVDVTERLSKPAHVEGLGLYDEVLVKVRPVWFGRWDVLVLPVRPALMPIAYAPHFGRFKTADRGRPELFARNLAERAVIVWAYNWALSKPVRDLLPAEPVQVEGAWHVSHASRPHLTLHDKVRAELNSWGFPLGFVLERAAPELFQQLATGYQQLTQHACEEINVCEAPPGHLVQAARAGGVLTHSTLYSAVSYIILLLLSMGGPRISRGELERELERVEREYLELRLELEAFGFNVALLDTISHLFSPPLSPLTVRALQSMYNVLFPGWRGNEGLAANLAVVRLGVEALRSVLELAQQDSRYAREVVSRIYSRVQWSKGSIPLMTRLERSTEFLYTLTQDYYEYISEIGTFLLSLWTARGDSSWLLSFALETARTLHALYGLGADVWPEGDGIAVMVEHPEAGSVKVVIPPRDFASLLAYYLLREDELAGAILGPARAVAEAVHYHISTSPEGFSIEHDKDYGPTVVARFRLRYRMLRPYKAGPQPSPYFLARELYRRGAPIQVAMRALYLGFPECEDWGDDRCLRPRALPNWEIMLQGFALEIARRYVNILDLDDEEYDGSEDHDSAVGVLIAKTIGGEFAAAAFRGGFCCLPPPVKPLYLRRSSTLAGLIEQVRQDIGVFRPVSTDIDALYRYSAAMVGLAEILEEFGVKARLHPLYEVAFLYAYYEDAGLAITDDSSGSILFFPARQRPYMYIVPRVSGLHGILEGSYEVDRDRARELSHVPDIFDTVTGIIRERGFHVKRFIYTEPWLIIELEDGTGILF